jgi:urease accessory protein
VAAAAHRLSADATVCVENVRGRNTVTQLRCETPLVLRVARAGTAAPAHLTQVSTAAAPLAGDQLRLHVGVTDNAHAFVRSTGATVVQPGLDEEPSSSVVSLQAQAGSTLDYQPQATILVAGSVHEQVLDIEYDDATILTKETLVLGRHQEPSGSCVQRTRVRTRGRTVFASSVALGALAPAGWDAVTGTAGHRCLISGVTTHPLTPRTEVSTEGWGAVHELNCGLRSITALGVDVIAADALWHRITQSSGGDAAALDSGWRC